MPMKPVWTTSLDWWSPLPLQLLVLWSSQSFNISTKPHGYYFLRKDKIDSSRRVNSLKRTLHP
uniref:Macaca fascicularis brain cDNA clone: QflA-21647, similar to human similar to Zinc finger protein 492 (LOC148198), mRNA, RefSeq: XM_047554.8 n=1 Tax=Macaca fascicularis TaxID=9541 RepID=I7GNN3_MACFA|nr:unnamed protein product [Macaca fascicularis]